MLPIFVNILQVIFVFVSLLIVLLVLMQRPKNEGLGAAFGGGMTDNLFGTQTTNVLQTVTRWLGFIFFALALLLSVLYVRQSGGQSALQEKLSAPTVVPATPAPATGATPAVDPNAPPAPDAQPPQIEQNVPAPGAPAPVPGSPTPALEGAAPPPATPAPEPPAPVSPPPAAPSPIPGAQ